MESELITPGSGGVYIDIYVQPGATHPGIKGRHGAALKIAVAARAVEGRATQATFEAVAELFGVRPSEVEVVAGQNSRHKRLFLSGVSVREARAKVKPFL